GSFDDRFGTDIGSRTRSIVDDEFLAESLRQPLTYQTRDDFARAARCKTNDDAHGPRRIGLRPSDTRQSRQRGRARGQMQKSSAGKFHGGPYGWIGWIGILNDLFCGRSYIAAPAELSIPFLFDEKSTVVPVRLAGEQSGGERRVCYGDARSNSERAAPSAWVGR